MCLVSSIRAYGLAAIVLATGPGVLHPQAARATVPGPASSGRCGGPAVVPEPAAVLLLILEHKDALALDSAQTERISALVRPLRIPAGTIVALDGPLGPLDGTPERKGVIRRAPGDPGREPPIVIDSAARRRLEEAHRARDEALELLTREQRRKLIEIEMRHQRVAAPKKGRRAAAPAPCGSGRSTAG